MDELLPKLAMSLEIKARSHAVQTMAAELEAQQVVLKATEAWYRGIIEAAPDGMLVIDANGMILMTNPQLDQLFGYDSGELAGLPIETLVPPEAHGRHVGSRDGFIAQGTARQMGMAGANLHGMRKDGSRFLGRDRPVAAAGHRRTWRVRVRVGARHQRPQDRRGRGVARQGDRRGRHSRQERLPSQYESRNPHADERHHRNEPLGAAHRTR